jgi:hypothetical protein
VPATSLLALSRLLVKLREGKGWTGARLVRAGVLKVLNAEVVEGRESARRDMVSSCAGINERDRLPRETVGDSGQGR